jgi:1-acyl-sn-glycerol-3-phosphate acyltransferase
MIFKRFFVPLQYTHAYFYRAHGLKFFYYFVTLCFGARWSSFVDGQAANDRLPGESIWAALLRHNRTRLSVLGAENFPKTGPVLVVANHTVLIDGILISHFLEQIRPKFKLLAAVSLLDWQSGPFIEPYIIPVDISSRVGAETAKSKAKSNATVLVKASAALKDNGVLLTFPCGAGPSSKKRDPVSDRLVDNTWDTNAFRLARQMGATIVPIRVERDVCFLRKIAHRTNNLFYTLLAPIEMQKARDQTITIDVLPAWTPDKYAQMSNHELAELLRCQCNGLAQPKDKNRSDALAHAAT